MKERGNAPERLDKILSSSGLLSRSEAKSAISDGRVAVDGVTVRAPDFKMSRSSSVCLDGVEADISKFVYIMLNKPAGFICSTDDGDGPTVFEFLSEPDRRRGLFPAGRLDKDTVGLLILTNDGVRSHRWLSPKSHVEKKYRFRCSLPVTDESADRLRNGVVIEGGTPTKSAGLEVMESGTEGFITLTEGKFHQIKRMFRAVGNEIVFLERVSFAGICLDPALGRGEYRRLNPIEMTILTD